MKLKEVMDEQKYVWDIFTFRWIPFLFIASGLREKHHRPSKMYPNASC